MRIAFASCMTSFRFPDQSAWDEIAARQPDVLVLLGDSAYYDADGASMSQVKSMSAHDFAVHAHGRLARQIARPSFQALVAQPQLTTHAIWDDHDFLWNGACGAEIAGQPHLSHLIPPSRAVFAAYRKALAARLAPGSFPPAPFIWDATTPEPGYSNVALGQNVLLHLTDGRSYKTRRGRKALLGAAQMSAIEAACNAADPSTVHLIASGIVFDARNGETWLDCKDEYGRMQALAMNHRILILSGDIHDNNLASYRLTNGRFLFEATSSGAAVCTAVTVGAEQRNWGLLNVDANRVGIEIFKSGVTQYAGSIDRATWT
ncbi:alkaline phosphatase D family protein [Variovorax sp. LjRoot290]|uniref:alkaline phosphatase D family protein n=1 Tax=unclassified Variovorax TaxID=663243 RepID=UPI000881A760|nr:alkaline phosphatase D family protein [Variovorax sp. CF079]SDD10236.1 PhoD-like phosphatase [Variovorax sp. CF079]